MLDCICQKMESRSTLFCLVDRKRRSVVIHLSTVLVSIECFPTVCASITNSLEATMHQKTNLDSDKLLPYLTGFISSTMVLNLTATSERSTPYFTYISGHIFSVSTSSPRLHALEERGGLEALERCPIGFPFRI